MPSTLAIPWFFIASYHEDASDIGTATNKPKQQQQQLTPTTTTISNIKLPILKKEEYDIWAMEMEHYLEYIDNDVWKNIRTRFGVKQIQRRCIKLFLGNIVLKHIPNPVSEGLEKRLWHVSQQHSHVVEPMGAESINKIMQINKFLRSFLPTAGRNLAMTMRTKPDVDTLSIDGLLYKTLGFLSKNSQVPRNHLEVLKTLLLFHTARAALTRLSLVILVPTVLILLLLQTIFKKEKFLLKFCQETGRRVRIDGNKLVGFDKKKLECFKCHNTCHFARECPSNGTNDGKKRDSFYQDQRARKKEQNQNCLLTMDDGVVNWGEHTVKEEETNHALMGNQLK
ncbi:ribonuclease H-like domain-containing protein [Tanacetum coccineum]